MLPFIFAGTVVIVGLMAVAIYYHILLYRQRQSEKAALYAYQESQKKHRKSLRIITLAMLDGQVSYTEASIRISVLMPAAGFTEEMQKEFSVFGQLANAAAHIPILDEWQALSKAKKRAFDLERGKLERQYADFLDDAGKKLLYQLERD